MTKDEKKWAIMSHLGTLIYFAYLFLIIPLGVWLINKEDSKVLDKQGKEIVNFQISMLIYGVASVFIIFLFFGAQSGFDVGFSLFSGGFIAFIVFLLSLFAIISAFRGAFAASRGEHFDYPLNLRLIK